MLEIDMLQDKAVTVTEYLNAQRRITLPERKISLKIKQNWDRIAKPLDGMGEFEELTAQIGAIQGSEHPKADKVRLLVFCADNGIVEEGISQSDQSVTAVCAKNIAAGLSTVGMMAARENVQIEAIDIGINSPEQIPGTLMYKVCGGTRNFLKEPAMTKEQVLRAMAVGTERIRQAKEDGMDLMCVGEMGIGNTTTSAALAAALLKCRGADVAGRGAGLDDAGLNRKIAVIDRALDKYNLTEIPVFEMIMDVGGLDIAGMIGAYLGGAIYHIPVMLDGAISMIAALSAAQLFPGVMDYMIPSHTSREPLTLKCQEALGIHPVLDAGMALGEGTGAMMALPLLRMAIHVYEKSVPFADYGVEQYKRYEQ